MSPPQVKSLHIEVTNICTLKCPACARTQFINQWPQHWQNHSIDTDQLLNFVDIVPEEVKFCGNDGDPIYHKDFHNIVKRFKEKNTRILIVTNGSYKNTEWWEQLTSYLDENDEVTFSIDGTPDNFTQYRINGDWESIKVGIDTCVKAKCKTKWKFIPFSFNEHNIDQAKKLSQDLGIDIFETSLSDRFHDGVSILKPSDELLGKRFNQQRQWRIAQIDSIDPKCATGQEHYISASGFYSPCCFVADFRFYYKTIFGKNKKQYNIRTTTLSEILTIPQLTDFHNTLKDIPVCQFNCPNTTQKN